MGTEENKEGGCTADTPKEGSCGATEEKKEEGSCGSEGTKEGSCGA